MIDGPTKDRGERTNKAFATIRRKFEVLRRVLDERAQRWWAGSEADAHGRGGVTLVHEATGMSRSTIRAGIREIAGRDAEQSVPRALRRPGGGRKRLTETQPELLAARPARSNLVVAAHRAVHRLPFAAARVLGRWSFGDCI